MSIPDSVIRAIHADALRIGFAPALRAHGVSLTRPGFRYRARRLGLPPISDGWHPHAPAPPPPPLRPGEFRCAKCGGVFRLPADDSPRGPRGACRARYRVGGADWCADCHARRSLGIDVTSPFFRSV